MPLLALVADYFRAEGLRYGLNADRILVEPILNWGGFTNRSFTISDGRRRLHLKLTEGETTDLERFFGLAHVLAERYRCPAALGWVEIPGSSAKGILFERVEGNPTIFSEGIVRELAATVGALHQDDDLRKALPATDATCASCYLTGLDRRFQSDLSDIEGAPPPFLTQAALGFMKSEADRLRSTVTTDPAFAEPCLSPIHGDLWPNNVLTDTTGSWFLIDWDDLRLGDPCLDLAMLTGPQKDAWTRRLAPRRFGARLSQMELERIAHYHRALLLDWVIDPLADWIEAEKHPQWKEQVRSEKEREHRRAMEAYRETYAARPRQTITASFDI